MAIGLAWSRRCTMERVEVVGSNTFVFRTQQLGPNSWSCEVFRRRPEESEETFLLKGFGESELEAFAMALSDANN